MARLGRGQHFKPFISKGALGAAPTTSVGTIAIDIAVGGVGVTGRLSVGAVGLDIAVAGVGAANVAGVGAVSLDIDLSGVGASSVILTEDGHDGGKRRRKEEKKRQKLIEDERERNAARRAQVIAAFEEIIEGKPKIPEYVAEEITKSLEVNDNYTSYDFQALADNISKVEALYAEYLENDDMEALLLL